MGKWNNACQEVLFSLGGGSSIEPEVLLRNPAHLAFQSTCSGCEKGSFSTSGGAEARGGRTRMPCRLERQTFWDACLCFRHWGPNPPNSPEIGRGSGPNLAEIAPKSVEFRPPGSGQSLPDFDEVWAMFGSNIRQIWPRADVLVYRFDGTCALGECRVFRTRVPGRRLGRARVQNRELRGPRLGIYVGGCCLRADGRPAQRPLRRRFGIGRIGC